MTNALPDSPRYSSDTVELIWHLRNWHARLGGLYRGKVKDPKQIASLWQRIDQTEAILKGQGIEIQ